MHASAWALTWQVWSRSRRLALALLVYLAALAVAAHAPGAPARRATLFLAAVPLAFLGLGLLAGFAFPDADVLSSQSGFPRWMLRLPVEARRLAFWPMLYGALTAMLLWWAPAQWVLRPLGVPAPLLWPAVMIAALLACLQALLWTPSAAPSLRVIAAVAGTPVLVIAGVNATSHGTPEAVLAGSYGALIVAAYGAATVGLNLARRGETPGFRWRLPSRVAAARPAGSSAFASPAHAQFWYEWRCNGLLLPFSMLLLCVLLTLPLFWTAEVIPILPDAAPGTFGSIQVNAWLRLLAGCLFFPAFLAAIFGYGRRKYDAASNNRTLHPFLATRPLPETAFIAARLRAAAFSTLLAWGILLVFATGWLLSPARDGGRAAPLILLLVRHCPPATGMLLWLLVCVLVFWTWRNQVLGIYADVSGDALLIHGAPLAALALLVAGLAAYVQWRGGLTGALTLDAAVQPLLTGLLAGAVLLKLAGAAGAAAALHWRLGVSGGRLAAGAAAWLATAAGLTLALCWISRVGAPSSPLAGFLALTYLPVCAGGAPGWLRDWPCLAALAALFTPFTRLALAPLLLARNRAGCATERRPARAALPAFRRAASSAARRGNGR